MAKAACPKFFAPFRCRMLAFSRRNTFAPKNFADSSCQTFVYSPEKRNQLNAWRRCRWDKAHDTLFTNTRHTRTSTSTSSSSFHSNDVDVSAPHAAHALFVSKNNKAQHLVTSRSAGCGACELWRPAAAATSATARAASAARASCPPSCSPAARSACPAALRPSCAARALSGARPALSASAYSVAAASRARMGPLTFRPH